MQASIVYITYTISPTEWSKLMKWPNESLQDAYVKNGKKCICSLNANDKHNAFVLWMPMVNQSYAFWMPMVNEAYVLWMPMVSTIHLYSKCQW